MMTNTSTALHWSGVLIENMQYSEVLCSFNVISLLFIQERLRCKKLENGNQRSEFLAVLSFFSVKFLCWS